MIDDIDFDNFQLDEMAVEKANQKQLAKLDAEVPLDEGDGCEGGACKI